MKCEMFHFITVGSIYRRFHTRAVGFIGFMKSCPIRRIVTICSRLCCFETALFDFGFKWQSISRASSFIQTVTS